MVNLLEAACQHFKMKNTCIHKHKFHFHPIISITVLLLVYKVVQI